MLKKESKSENFISNIYYFIYNVPSDFYLEVAPNKI
jgi:hypothetical protein